MSTITYGIPAEGLASIDLAGIRSFNLGSDPNYVKNVGYTESNANVKYLFSQENLSKMSDVITQTLRGVDETGRDIIVPLETISNVMFGIYSNRTPIVGDIYSRYNIAMPLQDEDVMNTIIKQTIELITSDVRNDVEIQQNNQKLTIWDTVLGDFNEKGLRFHAPIKIREKHPQFMAFNMNY